MRPCTPALSFAALSLLVATAPLAQGDEIREQLDLAIELYEEGDLAGSITELQYAIGEIQGRLGSAYAETFPPAPAGWTAEAPSQEASAAFFGGGTMVSRAYREENGSGSMNAQLMIDNPMIQGMAALFSNPAIISANPNMKRVRLGRENAILDFDEAAGRGEITFLMGGGRAMLKVEGSGLASGDLLVETLEAWDRQGLADVAGL